MKNKTRKTIGGLLLAASVITTPFFVKADTTIDTTNNIITNQQNTSNATCKTGTRKYLFLEAELMKIEQTPISDSDYNEWPNWTPEDVQENIYYDANYKVGALYTFQYRKMFNIGSSWFNMGTKSNANDGETFNQYNVKDADGNFKREYYNVVKLEGINENDEKYSSITDVAMRDTYYAKKYDNGVVAVHRSAKETVWHEATDITQYSSTNQQEVYQVEYGADPADSTDFKYDIPEDAVNIKVDNVTNEWSDEDFDVFVKMVEENKSEYGDYRAHDNWASISNSGQAVSVSTKNTFSYWKEYAEKNNKPSAYETFLQQFKKSIANGGIDTNVVMGNNGKIEKGANDRLGASVTRNYSFLQGLNENQNKFDWIVYKYTSNEKQCPLGTELWDTDSKCHEIYYTNDNGDIITIYDDMLEANAIQDKSYMAYNEFWMYAPAIATVTYQYDCVENEEGQVGSGIPSYGYLAIVLAGAAGVYTIAKKRSKFIKF